MSDDDDIDYGELAGGDALVDDEPEVASALVCDVELDDGSICGESFALAMHLGRHKLQKHGIAGKGKPAPKDKPPRKQARGKSAPRAKKPPEQKAAETFTVLGDRTAAYTQSLAFMALMAHIVVPPFDEYDLSVCNAGAPGLAAALDEVGQTNPAFRQGCDLVLGGGAGGAWVKLALATFAIATPIAANHGFLPGSVGARFGAQIGVAPAPSAPSPGTGGPEPATDREGVFPQPETADDVWLYLQSVPPRLGHDLAAMMMQGAGPTVVDSPPTFSPHAQPGPGDEDGAGGSEQLNPEAVAVS